MDRAIEFAGLAKEAIMNHRKKSRGALAAALAAAGIGAAVVLIGAGASGIGIAYAATPMEQFIPRLVYRTGPYAPNGIPFANGYDDYLDLLNVRDGGINGVKITYEECETGYNDAKGVECYERLKDKGPTGAALVSPLSTGITYALIPLASKDKIPIDSMGYGRTDAADGRVFKWIFPLYMTYQSQADGLVKYVAQKEGGLDKLKGKKIALVYLDVAYGREPIPMLEKLSKMYGFEFDKFPVAPPGLEQSALWLRLSQQVKPDWTFMWGWGVMNSTAIKTAAADGYPMDHFIGNWWSASEPDVIPAGAAAKGYLGASMEGPGTDYVVIQDILKDLYDHGKGHAKRSDVGGVLYNRGVVNAMLDTEAIRIAQQKYGHKPLTGEQVRWGFEHLDLDSTKLAALGFGAMIAPIEVTCANHEGDGELRIQQWDGSRWNIISGWIKPDYKLVRPLYDASAMAYAKQNHITPRSCAGENEAAATVRTGKVASAK